MIANEVKYSFSEKLNGLHRYSSLKKILIVDDQSYNIDAARSILNYGIGLENSINVCNFAFNGKQAIEMVIENVS
jgi:CheY-like chemotaxis protein